MKLCPYQILLPYEYVDNLPYNSDSNTGFPVFAFDEKLKKRDIQPYVIAYCKQLFKEVQRGTSAWDWVVTLVTRFFAKNEVRGPDDPIDKVRIIGTNGPLGDAFSRLVSMGALDRWSKFLPCFIGVSVWSTMVYTMLLAMEHRYFMKIDKRMRTKDIMVRHAHDTCYILLDLSSQDFTFNPLLLFITLWLRIFSYDFSKSPGMDRDMFINIFVLEMGYANCKVVHWLDDMFYIFLGMMCSGYLMTSHGDTISLIFVTKCVFMILLLEAGIRNPFAHWRKFCHAVYGDDTVIGLHRSYKHMFGCIDNVPDKLITAFQKFGLVLKREETIMLCPKPDHVDRFLLGLRMMKLFLLAYIFYSDILLNMMKILILFILI